MISISINFAHNYLFNYFKRLKMKNLKRFAVAFGMVAMIGGGMIATTQKAEAGIFGSKGVMKTVLVFADESGVVTVNECSWSLRSSCSR
ncbi:MAG: hypothetical protein ACI85I_000276 [Arenicella sp.]